MAKWTDDQIREAILIAAATSEKEAAERTGIPYMTLRRRAKELKRQSTKSTPRKLEREAQRAAEKAVEKASDYIYTRIRGLADDLYGTAAAAVKQAKSLIDSRGTNGNKDDAAWLKSLASTFHAAVQDAQLLSGKPTVRADSVNNESYQKTAEIIEQHPELLDAIFPENTHVSATKH